MNNSLDSLSIAQIIEATLDRHNQISGISYLSIVVQGIVISIVAAIIFLLILFSLRPKIKIADKICLDRNAYKMKIINKSCFFKLYDVNAELVFMQPSGVRGGQNLKIRKIEMVRDKIWVIERKPIFSRSDQNASYAVQFNTLENISELWDHQKGEKLHFKVIAKHGLSSFIKIKTITFHSKDTDIVKGTFGHGKDCNIHISSQ